MKKQIKKIVLFLLILVAVLFGMSISDDFSFNQVAAEFENNELLQINFLDVGQGDSIYIRLPDDRDILIDGGPNKNVLSQLGQVMPFWDRDIDIMILTHPHSDHVAGLVEVLKRFNVKQIYYTGVLHTTSDYIAWLEEIRNQEIPLEIVKQPFDLEFTSDIKLEFLYPLTDLTNQKVEDLNNTSIVNRLVYNDFEIMLTGDAEAEVEEELIRLCHTEVQDDEGGEPRDGMLCELHSDILKLGHHGSTSSSSDEFLEIVDPEAVIVQVGNENPFGHPHLRTIKKIERSNLPIYRNDQDGLIKIITDGSKYEVFTKE